MPRGLNSEWVGWNLQLSCQVSWAGKSCWQVLCNYYTAVKYGTIYSVGKFALELLLLYLHIYIVCFVLLSFGKDLHFQFVAESFACFLCLTFARKTGKRDGEEERKGWCYYKHCVLKLTCALIVMNVRRLRSLVDGFVTCGKQRIMNLSSRLSFCHSFVCIFGIQIQMKKSK